MVVTTEQKIMGMISMPNALKNMALMVSNTS